MTGLANMPLSMGGPPDGSLVFQLRVEDPDFKHQRPAAYNVEVPPLDLVVGAMPLTSLTPVRVYSYPPSPTMSNGSVGCWLPGVCVHACWGA